MPFIRTLDPRDGAISPEAARAQAIARRSGSQATKSFKRGRRSKRGTGNPRRGGFEEAIASGWTPAPVPAPVPTTPADEIDTATTISPQPSGPGGSGGSGGSGGRRGGGSATPPAAKTPRAVPPPPRQLDMGEITAALDAISAMFDLQTGELSAEMQAARQAFDFLKQGLLGAQERAIEQTRNVAAGRGILRSGLFLNETGRLQEKAAGQINQAAAARAARERAIQQRISGLSAAEAAQRAQEARRIAKEQVGTKEAIARALELV